MPSLPSNLPSAPSRPFSEGSPFLIRRRLRPPESRVRFLEVVKKHRFENSQAGAEPNARLAWQMTKRRGDAEVHKWAANYLHLGKLCSHIPNNQSYDAFSRINLREARVEPGWCADPRSPPCAGYDSCPSLGQPIFLSSLHEMSAISSLGV